ncbi:hypothetical protein PV11_06267 [Exophiala sideris]|uniref:Uncharacterized protein n=1 Tax=Exophiala sideris TaxID=1016849 RepID=A0A0D1YCT1_9EURO|nr:hypothetical protein PV11_06267 [Exophiala sideris]
MADALLLPSTMITMTDSHWLRDHFDRIAKNTQEITYEVTPIVDASDHHIPLCWGGFTRRRSTLGLESVSKTENGFTVYQSANPYGWKYGPTAVLTILIALWRQVDHAMKVKEPWLEMQGQESGATRSVLLDYVSPNVVQTLLLSLKQRHWRVSFTIIIFGLLKLTVAFSTALLAVRPTSISASSTTVELALKNGSPSPNDASIYYLDEVYGNIAQGLKYPSGTTKDAAYQEVAGFTQFPPNSSVEVEVLGFFPNLDCEDVTITWNFSTYTGNVPDANGTAENRTTTSLGAYFQNSNCSGRLDELGELLNCFKTTSISNQSACTSEKYYASIGWGVYCPVFDHQPNYAQQANSWVFAVVLLDGTAGAHQSTEGLQIWITASLCRPSYAIEKANLEISIAGSDTVEKQSLSSPTSSTGDMWPDYALTNPTSDLHSIVGIGASYVTSSTPADTTATNFDSIDPWFQLMLAELKTDDLEVFRDVSVMNAAATQVFRRLAAQWVGTWLSFPDHLVTNGSCVFQEARLHVQTSALWEMGVALVVVAVMTLTLALLSRRTSQLNVPRSLTELAASQEKGSAGSLSVLLTGSGHFTDRELKALLSNTTFTLDSSANELPGPAIKTTQKENLSSKSEELARDEHPSKLWRPTASHRWFAAICVCFPICEIAVLEILQHLSDAHTGICDTITTRGTTTTLIALLPATVMLGTAAMFSAAEFSITVFTPWSLMRRGTPRLRHVNKNVSEQLAPVAIIKAMSRHQVAVSLIASSTIVGSLLTIIVSGLFSASNVPKPYPIIAMTTDQFNPSWNEKDDDSSANNFALVQFNNASDPYGTIQDYAFNNISLDSADKTVSQVVDQGNTSTLLEVMTSVLHGGLNCTSVPRELMSYKMWNAPAFESNRTSPAILVTVEMDLPDACQFSTGFWQNTSRLLLQGAASIGYQEIPFPAAFLSSLDNPGASLPLDQQYYPPGCPSFAAIVGTFANDTATDDKTVLICTQFQEEIPATLRFRGPSLSLDPVIPIQLNQSKATKVAGYQYSLFDMFDFRGLGTYNNVTDIAIDEFYDTVVNWLGVPLEDMIGQENEDRFLEVTQRLYGLFMAQVFGQALRVEAANVNTGNNVSSVVQAGSELQATIYDPNRTRVFQDKTSKIILQACLGSMVVLFVTAYSMVDMRKTLPHNPCSIAGTLSLLAGSALARKAASIAEDSGDISQPERRIENEKVKLGWWQAATGDKPTRFGVDLVED